jgi:tetratricopeptide (TPR) repeat protein
LEPRIRRQKAVAARDCERLLAYAPDEQSEVVERSRSTYRSRPLAEELLRRSLALAHRDPQEALRLARLAGHVADKVLGLHNLAGGLPGLEDLRARCRAHQGNALRILGRWPDAERLFCLAGKALREGSGDPYVSAETYSLEASLLREQCNFLPALKLLEAAEKLYKEISDDRLRGRTMMIRGFTLREMGAAEAALQALHSARGLLNPKEEPYLCAAVLQNLADLQCELGNLREAARVLDESVDFLRLSKKKGQESLRIHIDWTEAKIIRGLGDLAGAERRLEAVRLGFEQLQAPFKVALVNLDLATLYFEQNRLEEFAVIAEQTYEGLRSFDLHPETEQALAMFKEAAGRRQLALDLVQAAVVQLKRLQGCWGVMA